MKQTKSKVIFLILALSVTFTALPALAVEGDEPLLVEHMVQTMVRQGVPEEGALRLARQNQFMAEMVTGTLEQEQQRLMDCDSEPVGDQDPDRISERVQDGALDGAGDKLSLSIHARVGSAFGRVLGAAYNNYGEEKCSEAAQALFSATRRGLPPETGAVMAQAFAENGYRLEEMYQFGMWVAERVSSGIPVNEEALCEQVRTLTRERVSLAVMTQKMGQDMTGGAGEGASQAGSRAGQPDSMGTGEGSCSSSGNDNSGNSSGGSGNSGDGQGN